MEDGYPRDLIGYGEHPPDPRWPGDARIAVQFVLNYEEGGERCVLHGDEESECFLSEIIGAQPYRHARHLSMESVFEYGSRAGVWRILRLFDEYQIPCTVFAVGSALARHPALAEALTERGHEICGHGWRWYDYQHVDENTEREHIARTVATIEQLTGQRPLGWYTGRNSPNTRRLVVEEGGFLYDADDYSDDLPFWTRVGEQPHLVVPYTLDANDMRFCTQQGFNAGAQFEAYLCDAFDTLYTEGGQTPRMMSIGLHARIVGRPGRFAALRRFMEHATRQSGVWFCRRLDIARHWMETHPA